MVNDRTVNSTVVTTGKPVPTFDDMKIWVEQSYKTELADLPVFIQNIIDGYEHTSMSKINLVNAAVACLVKKFYENQIIDMTDAEVDQSKWIITKMLFPNVGDGPISILKWNNILSPTSEPYFRSIYRSIFMDIQDSARLLIRSHEEGRNQYDEALLAHLRSIVDGVVPYGYSIVEDVAVSNDTV